MWHAMAPNHLKRLEPLNEFAEGLQIEIGILACFFPMVFCQCGFSTLLDGWKDKTVLAGGFGSAVEIVWIMRELLLHQFQKMIWACD